MTNNRPPEPVLHQFLRSLNNMLGEWEELLVPVIRGSVLLRHWFGDGARPAADIDLECFPKERTTPLTAEEQEWYQNGYGLYGEYESLVDFGKAMGRYSALVSHNEPIRFHDDEQHPSDGASLWVYGTPGERFYSGWSWSADAEGRKETDPDSGLLQIDYAESGSYSLEDISTITLTMAAQSSAPYQAVGYTQEMMLAAKLSWLLRGLPCDISETGPVNVQWTGELKDLFDSHLLLTQGKLNSQTLQQMLMLVGVEDKLNWNRLEALFAAGKGALTISDFHNWNEFVIQYPDQATTSPVEMLREVAEHLEPMLGDFYLPKELGFLYSIHHDPADEFSYLVYADWLEERGDSRCEFLRLFTRSWFHRDDLSESTLVEARRELKQSFEQTSQPWLHRLFQTGERYQAVRQGIRSIEENLLF